MYCAAMFDMEQAITQWRNRMAAQSGLSHGALDELESHLREDFRQSLALGVPEGEAFRVAVDRLGRPATIGTEFRKIDHRKSRLFTKGASLCLLASFIVMIVLFRHQGPLLAVHIAALTTGYLAALLMGCFGIAYTTRNCFGRLTIPDHDQLLCAIRLSSRLAISFVLTGLVLGILHGVPSHPPATVRVVIAALNETGAIEVVICLMALLAVQQWRPASSQLTIPIAIGAMLMTTIAWFGPFILVGGWNHEPVHFIRPVEQLVAIELIFLVLACLPRRPGYCNNSL